MGCQSGEGSRSRHGPNVLAGFGADSSSETQASGFSFSKRVLCKTITPTVSAAWSTHEKIYSMLRHGLRHTSAGYW